MPVLAQSVARHVGLEGSKMHTLSSILLTMMHFDSSKRSLSASFHMNLTPGLSRSRKRCIRVAMLKE